MTSMPSTANRFGRCGWSGWASALPAIMAFVVAAGLTAHSARAQDSATKPAAEQLPARPAGEQLERPARRADRPDRQDRPEVTRFREQMRKHITERIDRTRRTLSRLEEAQTLLDSGADPARLKSLMDSISGEWRRPDGGPGGQAGGQPGNQTGGNGRPQAIGTERPVRDRAMELVGVGGDPQRPLTPDERDELVKIIAEHAPDISTRLDDLKGRSTLLWERTIDGLAWRVRAIREAKAAGNDRMVNLRIEDIRNTMDIYKLAFEYTLVKRGGDPDRLISVETSLRSALGKQFDTRVAIRQVELEQLESRVDAMKKELEMLKGQKDRIIESVKKNGLPGLRTGQGSGPKEPRSAEPATGPGK